MWIGSRSQMLASTVPERTRSSTVSSAWGRRCEVSRSKGWITSQNRPAASARLIPTRTRIDACASPRVKLKLHDGTPSLATSWKRPANAGRLAAGAMSRKKLRPTAASASTPNRRLWAAFRRVISPAPSSSKTPTSSASKPWASNPSNVAGSLLFNLGLQALR